MESFELDHGDDQEILASTRGPFLPRSEPCLRSGRSQGCDLRLSHAQSELNLKTTNPRWGIKPRLVLPQPLHEERKLSCPIKTTKSLLSPSTSCRRSRMTPAFSTASVELFSAPLQDFSSANSESDSRSCRSGNTGMPEAVDISANGFFLRSHRNKDNAALKKSISMVHY